MRSDPIIAPGRSAFTLIELLVIIGIIGVLASLILPAVQAARETARRARCANNLRQLTLATNNFAAANGGFPSHVTYRKLGPPPDIKLSHASLHCVLLDYLEESNLFNAINFDVPTVIPPRPQPENVTAAAYTFAGFLCPSDPLTTPMPYGNQSYRGNVGLGEFRTTFRPGRGSVLVETGLGAFGPVGSNLPLSAFTDGMSNTIAYAEKRVGSGRSPYQPARDWVDGVTVPVGVATTADDWVALCSSLPPSAARYARLDSGRSWLLFGGGSSTFNTSVPPNSLVPDCGSGSGGGTGLFAARSYHPGGVNTAMADGSVRWFASSIATQTWRALGTRAGGEIIDQSSY